MSGYTAGYSITRVFAFLGWLVVIIGVLFALSILSMGRVPTDLEMALGLVNLTLLLFLLILVFVLSIVLYGLLFVGLSHAARALFDVANNTSHMIKLLADLKSSIDSSKN
ncbi:hypothetical protein MJD09_21385 [bacterium]|nr:hypothetical protein [bacterium]